MAPPVLIIGFWVAKPGEVLGDMPPRYAPLADPIRAAGFAVEHRHWRLIDPRAWVRRPPAAIVLTGSALDLGRNCQLDDFAPVRRLLDALPQVPVLGICFGCQFLAAHHGGRLGRLACRRDAWDHPVSPLEAHPLFAGLPTPVCLGEAHGMVVLDPGPHCRVIARSADGVEAFVHRRLPHLGTQFHPEYWPEQREPQGRRVLANWLAMVAGDKP